MSLLDRLSKEKKRQEDIEKKEESIKQSIDIYMKGPSGGADTDNSVHHEPEDHSEAHAAVPQPAATVEVPVSQVLEKTEEKPAPEAAKAPPAAEETKKSPPMNRKQRLAFLDKVIAIHKTLINEGELEFTEAELLSNEPAEKDKIKKNVEREVLKILDKDSQFAYLSRNERSDIISAVIDETMGLGPLEKLVQDKDISEIMVNGPYQTYVEYRGRLTLSDVFFRDNDHIKRIIDKIVGQVGRRIDEGMPMVDARLLDGSRVNAIIPPLALNGPTLTIRKFSAKPLQAEDLVRFGSMTTAMARFLNACVEGKLNIIVSGGTGSGKTTLLNVLSSFIPEGDRIITVEDSAELQLQQDHVVTLESRPPNMEGKGEVSIRDLIRNCLRMRPERIVVGEVRGGEALDMLQAMNTGHDGSMTTGHANTPRDMVARLETMVMMAGMDMPVKAIRQQIASAFHLIVQQSRLQDGSRKITDISEVTGMEGDIVTMQPIFKYTQTGVDADRKVVGRFEATGIVPGFYEKLEALGIEIDRSIFDPYGFER